MPNKRTEQTTRKILSKIEKSNLADAEFQTLVVRMLSDLKENFN